MWSCWSTNTMLLACVQFHIKDAKIIHFSAFPFSSPSLFYKQSISNQIFHPRTAIPQSSILVAISPSSLRIQKKDHYLNNIMSWMFNYDFILMSFKTSQLQQTYLSINEKTDKNTHLFWKTHCLKLLHYDSYVNSFEDNLS